MRFCMATDVENSVISSAEGPMKTIEASSCSCSKLEYSNSILDDERTLNYEKAHDNSKAKKACDAKKTEISKNSNEIGKL